MKKAKRYGGSRRRTSDESSSTAAHNRSQLLRMSRVDWGLSSSSTGGGTTPSMTEAAREAMSSMEALRRSRQDHDSLNLIFNDLDDSDDSDEEEGIIGRITRRGRRTRRRYVAGTCMRALAIIVIVGVIVGASIGIANLVMNDNGRDAARTSSEMTSVMDVEDNDESGVGVGEEVPVGIDDDESEVRVRVRVPATKDEEESSGPAAAAVADIASHDNNNNINNNNPPPPPPPDMAGGSDPILIRKKKKPTTGGGGLDLEAVKAAEDDPIESEQTLLDIAEHIANACSERALREDDGTGCAHLCGPKVMACCFDEEEDDRDGRDDGRLPLLSSLGEIDDGEGDDDVDACADIEGGDCAVYAGCEPIVEMVVKGAAQAVADSEDEEDDQDEYYDYYEEEEDDEDEYYGYYLGGTSMSRNMPPEEMGPLSNGNGEYNSTSVIIEVIGEEEVKAFVAKQAKGYIEYDSEGSSVDSGGSTSEDVPDEEDSPAWIDEWFDDQVVTETSEDAAPEKSEGPTSEDKEDEEDSLAWIEEWFDDQVEK